MLYIGLMSGTSIDSIDAALVDFSAATPKLIATYSQQWPPALAQELLIISQKGESSLRRLMSLHCLVGEQFALAVLELLKKAKLTASAITAIGSHGQNIFHCPNEIPAYTLQIGDPNTIAERTGIRTIADFRQRDVVKGGQGAPLAPAFHAALLASTLEDRVVVNIGGISNISVLYQDARKPVLGYDTGPGNALMNAWIEKNLQQPYDHAGQWAASGQVNLPLLEHLLQDPYFNLAPPKSTGRDYFNLQWLLEKYGDLIRPLGAADVQHTLLALTAQSLAIAIQSHALNKPKILLCGGGVHNTHLVQTLEEALPNYLIRSTADYGIEPNWMEAMLFAWLAKQTCEHQPGNLPSVTGAKGLAILGGIYSA